MSDNILTGLEMLLEEMDSIITQLNQQGVQLLKKKQYLEAKKIITQAETILAFQAKLQAQREEWFQTVVPSTRKTRKTKKTGSRTMTTLLEPGLRTPMEAYQHPILQALDQLGGLGRVGDILDLVEEMMKDKLNKYDYQPIPSNPKIFRWRKTAQWSRFSLVQEGYLASDSPRGVWEITEAGRKVLEASKKRLITEESQHYLPIDDISKQKVAADFIIGKNYHRQNDIHKKFGGSAQAGIAPCSKYPIIFLFNTPSGKKAGYEDGWVSDDTYYFTGQGQKGDMKFVLGNKAILNHESEGRALHLFSQVEKGRYKYLGQFRYKTHDILDGYDFERQSRKVIRFTLKKLE